MTSLRRRLRRMDVLDMAMIKVVMILVGIIIATYFSSLRGFVEQNILIVFFILVAIGVRPAVRYWKK